MYFLFIKKRLYRIFNITASFENFSKVDELIEVEGKKKGEWLNSVFGKSQILSVKVTEQ